MRAYVACFLREYQQQMAMMMDSIQSPPMAAPIRMPILMDL